MTASAIRARVRNIALALPEAACAEKGDYDTFTGRKKTFAYFLNDHHGDGIVCVAFSADLGAQDHWLRLAPERYLKPAHIGARGWTSLRLDQGKPDWDEVTARLREAYARVAPKSLVVPAPAKRPRRKGQSDPDKE
jgi:hypothetical protein